MLLLRILTICRSRCVSAPAPPARRRTVAVSVSVGAAAASSAPAAGSAAPPKAQPQPDAPPPAVSTPYDHDLQRLSEILGALHFLRGICGANEGQKWRNEAQALIDAEAPTGERHDQMVQGFNRGYRGFQQSYRTCTPAANSSFAAISKKAPRSPARSPPATPIRQH